MEPILINIAEDFTDAPGARNRSDGEFSGEEFYETILKPKFELAVEEGRNVLIDFDNSWGYASSFISGTFSRLTTDFGKKKSIEVLRFKSNDDGSIIDKVLEEINKSTNE